MSSALAIEISNGVIAVFTGLTLYGVTRIARWMHKVDQRLDAIEQHLALPGPPDDAT